jgi:aminoglycoside phosphotransferase family enzyme/predicted kinase
MHDQAAVIALLSAPSTYGVESVERVETHISVVFLAGPVAYKLKRAVLFDYLDFSTVERRRACCEEELRRNRRTAPALYLDVVPVTRAPDGVLSLGGTGMPVDWVVKMHRFDQAMLFDGLAVTGQLDAALMDPLGRAIAAFHREGAPRPQYGGRRGMQLVIDGNAAGLAEFGGAIDRNAVRALTGASTAALERLTPLLERRRRDGLVRECHGDLHLRNIVLIDGTPTLFDAIEFNDDIACADVLYDLAFLLMDLRHRGLDRHANGAWNAYLEETMDYAGLPLMPLFLSCRGAVRAKISATSARVQGDAGGAAALMGASHQYVEEAARLLHPAPPVAIAVGGVSGTGKSTLAAALAPSLGAAPGAVVLRSDVIRKQLCGAGRFDRLGPRGYTPEVNARVYAALADRAFEILRAGHSAIVDATFMREADRQAVEAAAVQAGTPLLGLWLDAPDDVLRRRLAGRQRDPSDADADILARQRRSGPGAVAWERVDAENSPDF